MTILQQNDVDIRIPALLAAKAIHKHAEAAFHSEYKEDHSPVTAADMAAHYAVADWIKTHFPHESLASEEDRNSMPGGKGFWWLLDPLDGTKEFVAQSKEYAVSLARLQGKEVIFGVLAAPALGLLAYGSREAGAWVTSFSPNSLDSLEEPTILEWMQNELSEPQVLRVSGHFLKGVKPLRVLCSLRHGDDNTDAHILALGDVQRVGVGACLKFLRLAEGTADYYPRLSSLHEWDIAGGHALVKSAGGNLYDIHTGTELQYGNPGLNAPPFIAY